MNFYAGVPESGKWAGLRSPLSLDERLAVPTRASQSDEVGQVRRIETSAGAQSNEVGHVCFRQVPNLSSR